MRFKLLLFILSIFIFCSGVYAQGTNKKVLFEGAELSVTGIGTSSWGTGSAEQSTEQVFTGGRSIKITTQSYFAGGQLQFANPIDLKEESKDPNRYLMMVFFFKEVVPIDPTGGYAYYYDIEPYTVPITQRVRVILVSDKGKMVATEQFTNPLDPDDNWVRMAIPLSRFNVEGEESFKLSKMIITSSVPATMFLGELSVLTDTEPIIVEKLENRTVSPGDIIFIMANAKAGFSSLKYSWDFDASNGIQQEWTERIARYIYTRPGEYTITLTVSDADGIKEPVTVTCVISVTG
ncbi:MAG: PKD domain-containing protein [Armatimonadota bacterium]